MRRLTPLAIAAAVCLAGCGDGLKAGSEAILVNPPRGGGTAPLVEDEGARRVFVDGLPLGKGGLPVGTLVRVVEDSGGGEDRAVKILILEGDAKGESATVGRKNLKAR